VLVGRREALGIDFGRLVHELGGAIPKVHARKKN
jgi:hypothetical protein